MLEDDEDKQADTESEQEDEDLEDEDSDDDEEEEAGEDDEDDREDDEDGEEGSGRARRRRRHRGGRRGAQRKPPRALVLRLTDALARLFPVLPTFCKHLSTYFELLHFLALRGPEERRFLILRGALAPLLDLLVGDRSPQGADSKPRKKKPKFGERLPAAAMGPAVQLLATLVCSCLPAPPSGPVHAPEDPALRAQVPTLLPQLPESQGGFAHLPRDVLMYLTQPQAIPLLLTSGGPPDAVARILTHLCWNRADWSSFVCSMIGSCLHGSQEQMVAAFAVFRALLTAGGDPVDPVLPRRLSETLLQVFKAIAAHSHERERAAVVRLLDFLREIAMAHPETKYYILESGGHWLGITAGASPFRDVRDSAVNLARLCVASPNDPSGFCSKSLLVLELITADLPKV